MFDQNVIETVGVIIFKDKFSKVLLVENKAESEHTNNSFGLPAGRIEASELPHQAALRELREETGLEAKPEDLELLPFDYTAHIERKDKSVRHFHLVAFYCKEYSGTLIKNRETEPKWVHVADMSKLKLLPNIEDAVMKTIKFVTSDKDA